MFSSCRRAVLAPALGMLILGATSQQASLPNQPGAVIRAAEQAVTTRRAGVVRQEWIARLRREPSNRLARLGIAAFARLAYDYPAVDSFARPLVASVGTKPDGITAWARIETAIALAQQGRLGETDSLLAIAADDAEIAGDGSA